MKALILAGGRGKRLNEFTKGRNKSMIEIYGKPLIEYNLDNLISLRCINEIIIVIGYKGDEIKKRYGNYYKRKKIKYVIQKQQKGLVHAIETAKKAIGKDDFLLMLADEIIIKPRLKEMIETFKEGKSFVICGVIPQEETDSISKTYTIISGDKGRIFRLIEKPQKPIENFKGTGHCIMKTKILDYINKTPINANRNEKELVDMIQCAIDDGKIVSFFCISGIYANINDSRTLKEAKKLIKENNIKVLIVHPQMQFYGGAELLIVQFANYLTKKEIKNTIISLSKSKKIEKELIDTKIIVPKNNIKISSLGFKNIFGILKGIKILRKTVEKIEKEYDLINVHNFPSTWATRLVFNKPIVWMCNEPPNLWSKPNAGFFLKSLNKLRIAFDRFVIRDSINTICVADNFNKKRVKERYNTDVEIIPYGIDFEFFSKGKKSKLFKNRFIILQSGVLTTQKNQLESLKTINKLKKKIPNILLIFAGKSNKQYKKLLNEYIKENNLQNFVLFTGNLDRDELRNLYATCHLGLFPIKSQGGWLAPFEIVCSGKPIIVSKEFTAKNLVNKNSLGIVSDNYAKDIEKIYKNPVKYNLMAKQSAKWIKENLTWEKYSERMLEVFKDTLE